MPSLQPRSGTNDAAPRLPSSHSEFLLRTPESGFDYFVANSVTHELAQRFHAQLMHDTCTVCFDGAGADVKRNRTFLVTLPLRQKLDDLAFARSDAGLRMRVDPVV